MWCIGEVPDDLVGRAVWESTQANAARRRAGQSSFARISQNIVLPWQREDFIQAIARNEPPPITIPTLDTDEEEEKEEAAAKRRRGMDPKPSLELDTGGSLDDGAGVMDMVQFPTIPMSVMIWHYMNSFRCLMTFQLSLILFMCSAAFSIVRLVVADPYQGGIDTSSSSAHVPFFLLK